MRTGVAALLLGLGTLSGASAGPPGACAAADALPVLGDPATGAAALSDLDDLMDRSVTASDGIRIGTVVDVVVDDCGQPLNLVLSLPGPGGTPARKVAVAAGRVHLQPGRDELRIDGLTARETAALPPAGDDALSLGR